MFCKDDLQSSYNFGRNVYPLINFTLFCVPTPNVSWSFHGEGGIAASDFVDSYMYKYLIRLPQLTQRYGFECDWVQQYREKITIVFGKL